MALILPVVVLVGMYFLMIRPQQRRMREREAMIRAAEIGDEVATVGGVIGIIVAEEGEHVVAIEVDTDVELRVQRRAIGEVLTKSDSPVELDEGTIDIDEHEGPISEG